MMKQPIYTGSWGKCHIQGITVDLKKGFIYYSFTTKLIKATLSGEIVGSVDGLMGHLGCIDFNEEDGRVYGSLEYKNDSIGKGILRALGSGEQLEDAFYIAIFDVDKIDRYGCGAGWHYDQRLLKGSCTGLQRIWPKPCGGEGSAPVWMQRDRRNCFWPDVWRAGRCQTVSFCCLWNL